MSLAEKLNVLLQIMLKLTGLTSIIAAATAVLPLAAQPQNETVSRAIVQPLPPPAVVKLNSALHKLARNSRDVDALIDAGNASLAVKDIDAAIGFFGRANDLSADNPVIKIGLAAAFVRRQRPIEALELFNQAERAGAREGALATDRGLAYDLVGDNALAQQYYTKALSQGADKEARRLLSLSHAIAGDRVKFEEVLLPLLKEQDFAAYRTRAFGLAILGDEDGAIAIADAVMPRDMAASIAPYLRYMPRLTKAQQASAASLGIFPRAAQIGRDTTRIAGYTRSADGADARLAPQGVPLGPRPDNTSPRRRPDRGGSKIAQAGGLSTGTISRGAVRGGRGSLKEATEPMARTRQRSRKIAETEAAPALTASVKGTATDRQVSEISEGPASASAASASASSEVQPMSDMLDTAPVGAATQTAVVAVAQPVEMNAPKSASVAQAFANFGLNSDPVTQPTGGVDITAIAPPREMASRAQAKPEVGNNPKRFWVQIATGKDRSALRFDWRRLNRKAARALDGKGPFVTSWGQSNRLLAGPYATVRAARNIMNSLKTHGVDSFIFTSRSGEKIDALR